MAPLHILRRIPIYVKGMPMTPLLETPLIQLVAQGSSVAL